MYLKKKQIILLKESNSIGCFLLKEITLITSQLFLFSNRFYRNVRKILRIVSFRVKEKKLFGSFIFFISYYFVFFPHLWASFELYKKIPSMRNKYGLIETTFKKFFMNKGFVLGDFLKEEDE